MGGQPVHGEWNRSPTPVGSLPSPIPSYGGVVSSQGLGTGWPGTGKEGEGAAWHRRTAWVCVACVFKSPTLEETVAQSKKAQLLESQKTHLEGRILA